MKGPRVTLRLALYGCTNRPFFHIVATNRKKARNKGYFEQVGTYDPMPNDRKEKLVALNMDRIKFWLSKGAGTSKPVACLLGLAGVFPLHDKTLRLATLHRESLIAAAKKDAKGSSTDDETGDSTR